jgi:uncharacterized sporulation protein YeaH/YhbH (DUF444 family)
MMDVSGSMGKEQKEIVRSEAFWIDAWMKHNYDDVETRFIIHDATAREVDRDTFFRTRESGGTLISSPTSSASRSSRSRLPVWTTGTSTRSTSRTATTGPSPTPALRELLTDR